MFRLFFTQMRALLGQKKAELEGMLAEYEQRMEEQEEHNQVLAAEKAKLKNQLQQLEEQWALVVIEHPGMRDERN